MADQIMLKREPAKRIFAGEFRAVKVSKKLSTDEKAPTFVITPTGEIASRMLIVGVLTQKDRVNIQKGASTQYRGRVYDQTGEFFVTAGQYQPIAMYQLSMIETPNFVAVVGKPRLYESEDGRRYVSINAESITVVDKETYEMWRMETSKATLDRIKKMEEDKDGELSKIKAEYNTNLSTYKDMVNKALQISTI